MEFSKRSTDDYSDKGKQVNMINILKNRDRKKVKWFLKRRLQALSKQETIKEPPAPLFFLSSEQEAWSTGKSCRLRIHKSSCGFLVYHLERDCIHIKFFLTSPLFKQRCYNGHREMLPRFSFKEREMLPWLMVVSSTDSLQPSASSRIASGSTSPKARIFQAQLI